MAELSGSIVDVPGTQRPADLAQQIAVVGWFAGLTYGTSPIATVQRSGDVKATAGYGKGSDLAAFALRYAEDFAANATCFLVPTPATVAGSITFDGQSGFGPAATLTATATHPHDDAEVRVRVSSGGAPGVAEFQVASAFTVTRNVLGGSPVIAPQWEAPRVMPARTAAALVGSVDITGITFATPAEAVGTVDLVNTAALYGSAGTLAGKAFDVDIDGGATVTITFGTGSSAPSSYLSVIATIDAAITGQGTVSVNGLGQLVLRGTAVSSAGALLLAVGVPDALAVLGLTAGSTAGTAGALDGLTLIYIGDATSGAQTWTIPSAGSAYDSADAFIAALTARTGVDASLYTQNNFLRVGSSTAGSSSTFAINGGTARTALGLAVDSATGAESEYVIEHLGVKVTFPTGTYSTGYERSWTVKAPQIAAADITNAIDALVLQEIKFGRVVVASEIPIGDLVSTIQAVNTKLGALEAANDAQFVHAVLMAPDEDDALVYAAFTSAPTRRVDLAARSAYVRPAVSTRAGGGALRRSQGWHVAGLYAAYALGSDLGQHEVNGRPAPAHYVDYVDNTDAQSATKLALLRNATSFPRALVDEKWGDGYYISGGYTLALPSSVYADQYVRDIILRCAQLVHAGLQTWLNRPELPLTSAGKLTDEGAGAVSGTCISMLTPLLPSGNTPDAQARALLTAARVSVDQNEVIGGPSGSQRMRADVVVQVRGIARAITFTVGAGLITEG